MNTNTRIGKANDLAHKAVEKVTSKSPSGIDLASGAAHQAADKVQSLREDIQPVIKGLTERAKDWAERGQEAYCQSRDEARQRFQKAADSATDYVTEKPMTALAIAAAAGAAAALIVGKKMRAN